MSAQIGVHVQKVNILKLQHSYENRWFTGKATGIFGTLAAATLVYHAGFIGMAIAIPATAVGVIEVACLMHMVWPPEKLQRDSIVQTDFNNSAARLLKPAHRQKVFWSHTEDRKNARETLCITKHNHRRLLHKGFWNGLERTSTGRTLSWAARKANALLPG